MATLTKDPKGLELEDFIAAHIIGRGCYVETGIKERNPEDILELDIVWTDYRAENPTRHPVEVKSGEWGLGDVFKFFGWTKYIGLPPGTFVHREPCGRLDPGALKHVSDGTGISFLFVSDPEKASELFSDTGLPKLPRNETADIWRFSFWAQRRFFKALNESIKKGVCRLTMPIAKQYYQLINDSVFFIPDVRDRVGELLDAHFSHQGLAASASYEIESGQLLLKDPPQTQTFKQACFYGGMYPIQTCLYLAHRARLYILKAIVDYWIAREKGQIKVRKIKFGDYLVDLTSGRLTPSMAAGATELSKASSFKLFPVFWQTFLWSWGGFILVDRLDSEYKLLEKETGVPVKEIQIALSAFDLLFPLKGGWFRQPANDSRKVLILMPPAMRGVGSYRRLLLNKVDGYAQLGYKDQTAERLQMDHNSGARLLDCKDKDLTT